MIRLSQDRTKTLLAIHGWSAVFLGLLLYAVVLTGVASVFEEELGDWSSPLAQRVADPYPAGLGKALQELSETVDPSYLEGFYVYPSAGGRLHGFFHRHEMDADGKPIERGVAFDIDPVTLKVINRVEGTDEEIEGADEVSALAHFFVELHVRLHVPDPWGLLLTGVLGLAMLVAAVSGLVIHRHLLKEIFTLRRRKDKLLAARDMHVVAGSWNLPFSFILAFTGSYFSFASAFGIPAMAQVSFGGDQEAMFETMIGNPPAEDPRPAVMGDLDAVIADVQRRSGANLTFLTMDHWGRADALTTAYTDAKEGDMLGSTFVYGGDTVFRYEKPNLGRVPSLGDSLSSLMAPLHFGNFAGVFSKAAWFALGFAGAYVTLTGLSLWTQRRREQRAWRHLARAVVWVGHGLPLALLASSYGYFLTRGMGSAMHSIMMNAFLGTAAVAAVLAWSMASLTRARRLMLALTGVALLCLPLARLLTGGIGWVQAMGVGAQVVISLDLALVFGGALCVWNALRGRAAQNPAATGTVQQA